MLLRVCLYRRIHRARRSIPLLPVRSGGSTCGLGYVGTPAGAMQFERRKFRLLRVFLLALTRPAHKGKVLLLGLFRCVAVAPAMLPHAARITGDAVRPVIHILAVLPTDGAVEIPVSVFFGKLFELFLVLLLLSLALTT